MTDPDAKRLLWFLFAGSRGGDNRMKIIDLLKERPYNINQLSESLKLDYKAIQHHISVLQKNNVITKMGEKYGVLYFISNYLEANIEAFLSNQAVVVLSGVAPFSSSKINFSFSCLISGITFSVIMLSKFFSSTSNAISI